MTNRRSNQGTLLSSIIAMVLCLTMFIGSTLAWFTSTVSNKGNRIEAGTLKVDLLMDKEETGDYVSIADGTGDIFSEATGNGILWEPGKTEIVFLKVENLGSLALKYNIVLTIDDEELAGGLEYAILDGVTAKMVKDAGIDSWKAIEEYAGVQIGAFPTGEIVAAPNGKILAGADGDYFALAVHMKEDADDDYQGKALSFDVKVMATQVPAEEDSFGPDYDEQAVLNGGGLPYEKLPNVELLTNGNFETMNADGVTPSSWNLGTGKTVKEENGNHYMQLTSTNLIKTSVNQTFTLSNVEPGTTLKIKGEGRLVKSAVDAYPQNLTITVIAWGEAGKTATRSFYDTHFAGAEFLTSDWAAFDLDYTVPVDDKISSAAVIQLKVEITARGDDEEVHFDNLQVLVEETKAAAIARTFRAMLAEEEANSVKVEPWFDSETEEKKDPVPGQTTVMANGDIASGDLTGWVASGAYVTAVEDPDEEGNYVIKLSSVMEDGKSVGGYQHANQWIPLVGGAEYQVTYKYKVKEGSTGYPTCKFEWYTDRSLAGVSTVGEKYVHVANPVRDGEWHEVVGKIYPPENCTEAWVLARLMGAASASDPELEYWIDDIEVVMTQTPSVMELDTDQIFYYTDAQKGIFKAKALLSYFPDLKDAKVDFQVYDGQSLIWENKGVTAIDGVASTEFSFRYLMQKEHPYTVKATMYNADGTIACEKTQNIYIYDRPEYLGADGIYMKNGEEPFYPVYAYHVSQSHFDEVAAAGINLVQMYGDSNVDFVLSQLDDCEKNGIMGLMTLYPGMKPAGHDSNIDTTVKILSDERVINHPALFGYIVMDEVYAGLSNPEYEMEKSYRLIRMLDSKHPITTMEAVQNYYYKGSSAFLRIGIISIHQFCRQ